MWSSIRIHVSEIHLCTCLVYVEWFIPVMHMELQVHLNKLECCGKVHLFQ